MPELEPILISVPGALRSLKKGSAKISWSKISQYRYCKANWFATNYADLAQTKTFLNEARALPGTLIQKLFEIYFNRRIYTLPPEHIELWLDVNLYWLYHVIKFNLEAQHTPTFIECAPRDFFKDRTNHPIAQARIQHAVNNGADMFVFRGIQPKFFNPAELDGGSEEAFLQKMRETLRLNIPTFNRICEGRLNKVFSEEYLQTQFMGSITLNGGADFIFNLNGNDNNSLQDIRVADGFSLWDGKYNYRAKETPDQEYFTDPDQLFFYTWILMLKTRKLPKEVGFIEWKTGKYFPFPHDMNKFEALKSSVFAISNVTKKVTEGLMNTIQATLPIEEVPGLEFNPGRSNCQFCPIKGNCAAARAAGITINTSALEGISDTTL